jgi:hypothetical protein
MSKTYTELDMNDEFILSSIFHSIPTGVFVIDQNYKIKTVNQAAAIYTDRSPDDCCERSCSELFQTGVCNTDNCCVQHTLATGQSSSGLSCLCKQQKDNPVNFYCVPLLNQSGQLAGCILHLLQKTTPEHRPYTLSSDYEQLLEQLNNQWASNQELARQNEDLHQMNKTIGTMASEKTAIELVMMMVDRLRNSATCISGLLSRHLRSLPPLFSSSKTALAVQDEIRRLEERMHEIETLLDKRQRIFQTTPLGEIINAALFSCSRLFHEQKISLILKKSPDTVTIKACREILTKALSIIFRQLAVTISSHQAIIEVTHDRDKAYITCNNNLMSHNKLKRAGDKLLSSNSPCCDHNQMDLLLARHIIVEHGGEVKEVNTSHQTGHVISLPKEWRML